jgi:hypothetical protein
MLREKKDEMTKKRVEQGETAHRQSILHACAGTIVLVRAWRRSAGRARAEGEKKASNEALEVPDVYPVEILS